MKNNNDAAPQRRRDFLKAAGGAALALVAAKDAGGQAANAKAAGKSGGRAGKLTDRGLWATWYDLPENGRDNYLGWLHGTYLPIVLKHLAISGPRITPRAAAEVLPRFITPTTQRSPPGFTTSF